MILLHIRRQTIHSGVTGQPFMCGVQHCELYEQRDFPNLSETASRIGIKPAAVERTLLGLCGGRRIISPELQKLHSLLTVLAGVYGQNTEFLALPRASLTLCQRAYVTANRTMLYAFRIFWRFFFASQSQIFGKSYRF